MLSIKHVFEARPTIDEMSLLTGSQRGVMNATLQFILLLTQKVFDRIDDQVRHRKRVIAVLMLVTAALAPMDNGAVLAASFKIAGNEMVEVKAYGETLVFRQVDAEDILFSPVRNPCHAPKYDSVAPLSVILNDQVLRECIEKNTPDKPDQYGAVLTVRPKHQGINVYPGPVKATAYPNFSYKYNDIYITLSSKSGTYDCDKNFLHVSPDELGFLSQPIGYVYQNIREYQLPGSLRVGVTSRPLCVICLPILGDIKDRQCYIRLKTADAQTSMTLSWTIFGFHGPDSSWITYDKTARNIVSSIFVNRPKGDLQ